MSLNRSDSDSFSHARQKKREIFQSQWNHVLKSPVLLAFLIILTAAQTLFFLFSGGFIRFQAIALGLLHPNHPRWYWAVIAAVQMAVSAPGFGLLLGLWKTRKKSRWVDDAIPDVSGIKLMLVSNSILCIITGMLLALYPTIMVTAGEYLNEAELLRLFYLLLASSLMFLLSIFLVRVVLKYTEENVTCCWTNTRFLLLLMAVLLAAAAVILLYAPRTNPFFLSAAGLSVSYGCFLLYYKVFLQRIAVAQMKIDRELIVSRENPDDPYTRY